MDTNERKILEDAGVLYPTVVTNADRIRSMSDEELADEILRWFNWLKAVDWDDNRILNWLRQDANNA